MRFFRRLFDKEPTKTIETYSDFWAWFIENERSLYSVIKSGKRVPEDFITPVHEKLNELRDECFFLLAGMFDEDRAELIITSEGIVKNFVFAVDLVNAAPSLDNWKFTSLKPAIDIKDIAIRMGEIEFRKEKIKFYPVEVKGYPDLISLKITHEDFTDQSEDLISHGVYIYMDHIIGERNFMSIIDDFEVVSESSIEDEVVPIEKINDYLIWRQKEFFEKYEGQRRKTEEDQYILLEATLRSGNRALSTLNTDLLKWDSKASHPWILVIKIEYNTKRNDGLPDDDVAEELNRIEDIFLQELQDINGYLNIGRETGDWLREIFFACKETDWCSRKANELIEEYEGSLKLEYDLYKDKYWKRFEKYKIY